MVGMGQLMPCVVAVRRPDGGLGLGQPRRRPPTRPLSEWIDDLKIAAFFEPQVVDALESPYDLLPAVMGVCGLRWGGGRGAEALSR